MRSFSWEPLHPKRGIHVLLGSRVGKLSPSEVVVFPAVWPGGWHSGRGAIFPVESGVVQSKQTKLSAKPGMVYLQECRFSLILEEKKGKKIKWEKKTLSFPLNPCPISLVSIRLDRGPK